MNKSNDVIPHLKLLFHIEHPSLEECWSDGYLAAQAEISESDNPFKPHMVEFAHWNEGWWAGFYGEEPLYDIALEASDIAETSTKHTTVVNELPTKQAANESTWAADRIRKFAITAAKIASAIAATAVISYGVMELAS